MSSKPTLLLTDRLRGKYVLPVNDGAGLLDGEDTFTREFKTPPIQHEAAARIEALEAELALYQVAAKYDYTEGGLREFVGWHAGDLEKARKTTDARVQKERDS